MAAFRISTWLEPASLVEVAVPEPGPGQVRVRVAGCGLCHSDLAMGLVPADLGAAMGWTVPFTLGHETGGWIDAIGPGVSGMVEGAPVAVASPASCGTCRWCRRGAENACPGAVVGRGYGQDGGLAEYVLVDDPGRALFPLGDLDPAGVGPLTDAGATVHHAVSRVAHRVHADGTVLVLGAGGLGSFAVQLARLLTPGRVVAVDPNPARRARALELGAHDVVDGVDDATAASVRELLGTDPVDAVVDLVGTDATIALAATCASAGGAVALVGAARGTLRHPWYGTLPRDGEVFTFQGSDLADTRAVLALAADGRLRVDVDPFALADVAEAYHALEQGRLRGRALVRP